MADNTEMTMVVGQGARLEGAIVSAGSLRIDGQVKGQITAEGDVIITKDGMVDADIKANNVLIGGRFKGLIVVKSRTEIQRGGRVDGNINSKILVIEEGGLFQGQSIMEGAAAGGPATNGNSTPASQPAQAAAGQGAQKADR